MPNHFHLMLETPRGNLSRAMRHLGASFTQKLNAQRGWDGPVFRGRFRNRLVEDDAYWRHLLAYIHHNPVRAGLAPHVDATDFSSHAAYAGLGDTPAWLTTEDLLALFGGRAAYRDYLWAYMAGRAVAPPGFEVDELWTPRVSDELAAKGAPPVAPMSRDEALACFVRVTGADPATLREGRRGRRGNPARQLAAWWLARAADLKHAEIARELDASIPLISRWMRTLGTSRSDEMEAWVRALEDVLHPPPPGLKG
jgi:hypothetical protein